MRFDVAAYRLKVLKFLMWEIFVNLDYLFQSKTASPRILDGGSNIGMSILFFKLLWPEAEVIESEPSPNVFSLLQQNLKHNGFEDVNCTRWHWVPSPRWSRLRQANGPP